LSQGAGDTDLTGWTTHAVFVPQNRGAAFSLDPAHPNRLAPGKRPLHSVTSAVELRDGAPAYVFGVTGCFIQPQSQVIAGEPAPLRTSRAERPSRQNHGKSTPGTIRERACGA
jgi:hypothetical protein